MMQGPLNEIITIQRYTEGQGAAGNPTQSWTDLTTVRCKVKQNAGSKEYDNDTQSEIHSFDTTFSFRNINSFGYDCRIQYESETYEILSIQKIRRKEGFIVIAKRNENN